MGSTVQMRMLRTFCIADRWLYEYSGEKGNMTTSRQSSKEAGRSTIAM